MAISKYIPNDKPVVNESELERAINKGGSTLKANSSSYRIQVRIPQDILSKIDHAVKETRYEGHKFSRHAWIMRAILEKLNKEPNK